MTRLSQYFLPTEKQPPADAEALSHKLLVRAGMIRQVGAGLWSWLPAGWRVQLKTMQIIREELDAIGAHEMLMPVLNPAEIWRRTGRYDIDELFKLKDRKGADMVLALTHEEIVTTHVAQVVRSYRDLPQILYHFQTKGRDEARPRAGVLRTREFIMKDSYTFDRDAAGLDVGYEKHRVAYDRIFDRCGLEWYRVDSDVGMMGGTGAHEYMAPCPAGENDVALAPDYAANIEVATATPQPVELPAEQAVEEVTTPGATTVAQVCEQLGVPAGALIKAYPVIVGEDELRLVLVRGDHRVNDIKLTNALGAPFRPAQEVEFADRIGPAGYIGPVGMEVPILLDSALDGASYISGANKADTHLRGVKPGRDFQFTEVDVRTVEAGDTVDGHPVRIEPAIEIGNIFKLGTRYSVPLGATFLDEDGTSKPIWMGSYGIGPARIAAAAVEQFADEAGISWPRALAPFDIHLVAAGKPGTDEFVAAEKLYEELRATGLDIVFDDRATGAGAKFADAELLGVPLRLTVGRRSLESGEVEAQIRRGRESRALPLEGAAQAAADLWATLP
ncbi:proline--tRNA ligase [Solirubrobacter soli]|uniref:proline--tRNA ligase n=1 Tax=Solirubrobacter soli TaxID=363832 RepID=UPI00040280AA|nr:proline--tRNA ligase [Solirubrobacter soli]